MAYINENCNVDGCNSVVLNVGLCSMHYQRKRRHGGVDSLRPKNRTCSIHDCKQKHMANGYCNKHYTHQNSTPEYKTWLNVKARCYNEKSPSYSLYGGRGISVADEWLHDYTAFLSYMGKRPSAKHSIDRINSDGNYEPGNVRWATPHQQNANLRSNKKVVGVTYDSHRKHWKARLMIDGKNVLSRCFKSFSGAVTARKKAEVRYEIYI